MAKRPVYLNPLRIHLPVTGWVSILHRVSGALLFLALPFGVWGLSVSLSSAAGFRRMAECVAHPLARLFLLFLIWAFAHHFFAGLRFLALDLDFGGELAAARRTSVVVLAASLSLTLLIGVWLW